ncbi:ABC-type proline/glycine betaine transport system, periplasmic component [Pseudomonas antarctica]|uniref:ABC-type proline/glycine betaine transport system, periplasmic component n=1 Tax=Pseudomonas antarctica TaxID=219572 RepID=A0A172Z4R8_9PSED|nr:glycine betaine ABC transporter substrate-binding protein [Pseudomonas antarctica]ANF87341.1 ABC-type proline/glycine betaine transport system, periplasmic component [Pseudomonas antarctica]
MKALRSANVQMTSDRVIKLGVIDLSFHRATAAVVTKIFEILGFTVERNFALHEETFRQLRAGDIDMVVSAWLPHSHGNYKKEVEQRVATVELGTHYEPFAYWGVPYYIPQQCVNSVEDLRKPDVKEGHKTMGPRENSNG